jgi:hypothetical protein
MGTIGVSGELFGKSRDEAQKLPAGWRFEARRDRDGGLARQASASLAHIRG